MRKWPRVRIVCILSEPDISEWVHTLRVCPINSMQSKQITTSPWSTGRLLVALACLGGAVLATLSAWRDWYSFVSPQFEEYSHVFLVVPFGLAIIFANRARLSDLPHTKSSWVGCAVVALGGGMAWYGFNYSHQSLWHLGSIAIAVGVIVTVLGHSILFRFWPAFLILPLMVPTPHTLRLKLALPLQNAMAYSVDRILNRFGEPVVRNGNSLTINGNQVEIVEACNGMRMVFTLILVSWLFAFITPLRGWVRALILLLSPLLALVCNIVRLVPTMLIYGHGNKSTADAFHDYAGWGMIFVAFFLLIGMVHLLEALGLEVRSEETDHHQDDKPSHSSAMPQGVGA